MKLLNDFTELFGGMSIAAFICLTLGVILIAVEFFEPTKGRAAACGVVITAGGMCLRMLAGGTAGMLFIMTALCLILLVAAHLIMLGLTKRQWLSHSASLSIAYREIEQQNLLSYSHLAGREGVATTDIDGSGHMSISSVNFFVSSLAPIKKGERVRVTGVEGDKIIVEALAAATDEE